MSHKNDDKLAILGKRGEQKGMCKGQGTACRDIEPAAQAPPTFCLWGGVKAYRVWEEPARHRLLSSSGQRTGIAED